MDDETEGWGARKVRSLANKPAGDPPAAPLAHIPNLGYSIPLLRAVERYRIQYIGIIDERQDRPGTLSEPTLPNCREVPLILHRPFGCQATSHWASKAPTMNCQSAGVPIVVLERLGSKRFKCRTEVMMSRIVRADHDRHVQQDTFVFRCAQVPSFGSWRAPLRE
jgi:hypothetical protein